DVCSSDLEHRAGRGAAPHECTRYRRLISGKAWCTGSHGAPLFVWTLTLDYLLTRLFTILFTEVASGSPMTTMVITTGHYPTTHCRPMTSTTPAIYQTGTKQSLTDRHRNDIVAGNLETQQRLVEDDDAEEHQAARGDVRLALYELITEGLVERNPNPGARVRKVSLQ